MKTIDQIVEHAWNHARACLVTHRGVPDCMLMGQFDDDEIGLAFPDGNTTKDEFAQGVREICAANGCEFVVHVFEAWLAMKPADEPIPEGPVSEIPGSTEVVWIAWSVRGEPDIRAQYAVLGPDVAGQPRELGPVSSMSEVQQDRFLDGVFGPTLH